jgi:hypothetical protein
MHTKDKNIKQSSILRSPHDSDISRSPSLGAAFFTLRLLRVSEAHSMSIRDEDRHSGSDTASGQGESHQLRPEVTVTGRDGESDHNTG